MKARLTIVVVVAVVVATVIGGCRQAPAEEKVLKIGVMSPYTREAVRAGEEHKDAFIMAFEAIDYKVGDYKIELVWVDTQADPEVATRAYEEAVLRDKIDIATFGWYSSVEMAVMDVAAKHGVPHFFPGGSSGALVDKYRSDPEKYQYYLGKYWPNFDKLQVGYVTVLEENIEKGILSPNRTAVLVSDLQEGCMDQVRCINSVLEDYGWDILGEEHFETGEMDFYPVITKIKSINPAVVYVVITPATSFTAFIKQAGEVGLDSLIIADGLGWAGEWYEATGEASDYVLDLNPVWSVTEEAVAFYEEFESRWGLKPGPSNAGLAYDYANFLIKVLQRTLEKYGELSRETLLKVGLEEMMEGKLTYNGMLMKEYKFAADDKPELVVGADYFTFPVLQYFGGEPTILWPDYAKEGDLKVPPGMR